MAVLSRKAKPLTLEEGNRILERDHYKCQYCGLDGLGSFENSLIMSVDFIVPRARKGKKEPQNLVASCRPCNVIKGGRKFANFEEAKAFVLNKREELRQKFEAKVAATKTQAAKA
jgi:5-methylcytosine-specific restriction endonuclease McrA